MEKSGTARLGESRAVRCYYGGVLFYGAIGGSSAERKLDRLDLQVHYNLSLRKLYCENVIIS
jgi:hypothetical protein